MLPPHPALRCGPLNNGSVGNAVDAFCCAVSVSRPVLSRPLLSCPTHQQVRPVAEDEMFKVLKSGKRMKKSWKRMITKVRAGVWWWWCVVVVVVSVSVGCVW